MLTRIFQIKSNLSPTLHLRYIVLLAFVCLLLTAFLPGFTYANSILLNKKSWEVKFSGFENRFAEETLDKCYGRFFSNYHFIKLYGGIDDKHSFDLKNNSSFSSVGKHEEIFSFANISMPLYQKEILSLNNNVLNKQFLNHTGHFSANFLADSFICVKFDSFFQRNLRMLSSSSSQQGQTGKKIVMATVNNSSAKNIYVSNAEELYAALEQSSGGETILLAEGDYGKLSLNAEGYEAFAKFSSEVTIKSANPNAPADFSGAFLKSVENLTFENVVFDYEADPGAALYLQQVRVEYSSNVTFNDVTFDGDLSTGISDIDDGYGTGIALGIVHSNDVTLENSEFYNYWRAAAFSHTDDLTLRGNDLHSMRSDGFVLQGVERVLIEGNHIHDFDLAEGSDDHADFIQFFTVNTTEATRDIIIRDNILDIGDGDQTQSIFLGNEAVGRGAGEDLFYQNVTIENNVIRNAHLHGITVDDVNGLTVSNNTLLFNEKSGNEHASEPRINISGSSKDVVISNNVTHGTTEQEGWEITNNLIIQRESPNLPNYYGDLFVNALVDVGDDLTTIQAVPGGLIETRGLGSSLNLLDKTPDELVATIQPLDTDNTFSFEFDAGLSRDEDGFLGENEAEFKWDFGDGTTATGRFVDHVYDAPGDYAVTLTVTHSDGRVDQTTSRAVIEEPQLLHLDFVNGDVINTSTYTSGAAARLHGAEILGTPGEEAIRLKTDTSLSLSRDDVPQIFNLDEFSISFKVEAEEGRDSAGEFFRIHGSMIVDIDENGRVNYIVNNSDGEVFEIESNATNILDGNWHDVTITFDGPNGVAEIFVDGAKVGEGAVEGQTVPRGSHGLNIGSPFGHDGFSGLVDDFEIRSDVLTKEDIAKRRAKLDEDDTPVQRLFNESDETFATLDADALKGESLYLQFDDRGAESYVKLTGDAHQAFEGENGAVVLDGKDDEFYIGRLENFADSSQVTVALDFQRSELDEGSARLLWNHQKYGLTVKGDELIVSVRDAEKGIVGIKTGDIGLNDLEEHRVVVTINEDTDAVDIYVDEKLVVSNNEYDVEFYDAYNWNVAVGGAWGQNFAGQIDNLLIADEVIDYESTYGIDAKSSDFELA